METPSRVAGAARAAGVASALLVLCGPLLGATRLAAPMVGFQLFLLGGLASLAALVIGIAGLWRTREATGRPGRRRAVQGLALGAASLAVVMFAAAPGGQLPPINDITTDPDDPPEFTAAAQAPPNTGRDLAYPGETFASQQRAAYPDLVPLRIAGPPATVFEEARAAARALGWQIAAEDPAAGVLEAFAVSRIFGFVDDVVVRIRPAGEDASLVDVRSKSRDGRGDLGANARRIRRFRDELTGDSP